MVYDQRLLAIIQSTCKYTILNQLSLQKLDLSDDGVISVHVGMKFDSEAFRSEHRHRASYQLFANQPHAFEKESLKVNNFVQYSYIGVATYTLNISYSQLQKKFSSRLVCQCVAPIIIIIRYCETSPEVKTVHREQLQGKIISQLIND